MQRTLLDIMEEMFMLILNICLNTWCSESLEQPLTLCCGNEYRLDSLYVYCCGYLHVLKVSNMTF